MRVRIKKPSTCDSNYRTFVRSVLPVAVLERKRLRLFFALEMQSNILCAPRVLQKVNYIAARDVHLQLGLSLYCHRQCSTHSTLVCVDFLLSFKRTHTVGQQIRLHNIVWDLRRDTSHQGWPKPYVGTRLSQHIVSMVRIRWCCASLSVLTLSCAKGLTVKKEMWHVACQAPHFVVCKGFNSEKRDVACGTSSTAAQKTHTAP
jgi:hypothetical protein